MDYLVLLMIVSLLAFFYAKLAARRNRRAVLWGTLTGLPLAVALFIFVVFPSITPIGVRVIPKELVIVIGIGGYVAFAFFLVIVLVFPFLPPLCSECGGKLTRKQWKAKECPHCEEA